MTFHRHTFAALALAGITTLAGCDSGPLAPGEKTPGEADPAATEGNVTISLAGPAAGSAAGGIRAVGSLVQARGGDELVLDSVQVVLREIELKRVEDDDCDDDLASDDCEKVEAGPRLLHVPLEGSVDHVVTVSVPAGSYDELEFEIHKPDDDDAEDRAFLQEHPTFEDVSVRVKGSFNGESFVFVQDLNEDQERDLVPAMVVGDDGAEVSLTLRLAVDGWFVRPDGSLVDPVTAAKGGVDEDLVEENIERSIEVFEDADRDGVEDEDD